MAPVDPVQHVGKLRQRDRDRPRLRRRPDEAPVLQPLGVERHPHAVVPEDLQKVAPTAPGRRRDRPRAGPGPGPPGPAAPACSCRDACPSRQRPATPAHRHGPGSSSRQRDENAGERRGVHARIHHHPRRHSRVRSTSGRRRSAETAPRQPGHPPRSSLEPGRRYPTDRPGRASARQTPGWRSRRDGAPRPKPRRLPQSSPERSDASPPPASDGEAGAPRS